MKRPLKKIFFYKKKAFKAFCLFVYRHIQGKSVTSVAHLYQNQHGHCRSMTLRCPWKSSRTFICKHCFHDGTSYLGLQLHQCFQVLDAESPREQQSPASQAPGTTFMEDNSSTDRGWGWGSGWFGDDSSTWHLLCTLFLLLLHQLHLRSQGWEDLLEEGTAAHFSILDWEIPWTEEPGGLQSMGSQRVRHNLATKRKWRKPVTSVAHLYAKHISGHCRSIALLCLRKFHRLSYVNISFTAGASYLDTADKEFAKKGKAKEMTQAT